MVKDVIFTLALRGMMPNKLSGWARPATKNHGDPSRKRYAFSGLFLIYLLL